MNTSDIINSIRAGEHDEVLYSIETAIKNRRKAIATSNGAVKGGTVRLVNTGRATLDGRLAKVLKVNTKTISVVMLDDQGNETFEHWRVGPRLIEPAPDVVHVPMAKWDDPTGFPSELS